MLSMYQQARRFVNESEQREAGILPNWERGIDLRPWGVPVIRPLL